MTSTPTPLSPEDDRDFQQFTGVFDRPVAPCPAFAERLRQQAIAASNQEREHTMHQIAMQPAKPMAEKQHLVIPIPARRQSGGRFIEIVAAAVLVVALLGSMFWMDRLQNGPATPGPDPNGQRLAAVTPPGASATPEPGIQDSDSIARGGELGATSARSLVDPGLTISTGVHSLAWTHVVADPLWVMPFGDVVASLGSSDLTVQDAATGNILWTTTTEDAFRNSQYDTERNPTLQLAMRAGPYARPWIEANTLYYATTTEIVGVDLHTGIEVFRALHTEPESEDAAKNLRLPFEMSVRDGIAYLLTSLESDQFNLTAIDLGTGHQYWQYRIGNAPEDALMAYPYQLVVTSDMVVMQIRNGDENFLLALNTSDGSVAWEQPNALTDDPANNNLTTNISTINDEYLVLTHQIRATGTTDGESDGDEMMGVAFYNLADGSLIWTAHEGNGNWTRPKNASESCWIIPGWDDTALYVSCSTEDTLNLFRFPFEGNGEVEQVGTWNTDGIAYIDAYSKDAAYFNTEASVIRIDLASGERLETPLGNGNTCSGRLLPANSALICINDNSLGTYTIQGFVPAADARATPAPSTVLNSDWTDPGHTNAYPAGFELQTAQSAEQLGDLQFNSDTGVIVGNTLILVGTPPNTDPTNAPSGPVITGIDLPTGRQLWSEQRNIAKAPVAGQDAFLTVEMTISAEGTVTIKLVSLSPQTGQINWEHSLFQIPEGAALTNSNDLSLLISNPIVIEDHVYIANGIGNIKALDTKSGEIAWQSGDFDLVERLGGAPFGSLVGNDDYLFVVNYKNEIVKYDVMTGDAVETFTLDEHSPDQRDRLHLYLSGNRLVVFALNPIVSRSEPNHDAEQEANGLLQILDSESGEPLWATDLTGTLAGSPVVANGIIGIPQAIDTSATPTSNADNGASGVLVSFYNLENGNPPGNIVMPDSREASVSASGAVICIHGTSPQLVCSDTARQGSRPQTMDIGAPYIAEGPPSPILFWNSSAIVLGHEGGPYIIRSGEQLDPRPIPLPATPQSSPPVSAVQEDATPAASPELTNDNFQPDYQTTGTLPVNLRWGPGLRYGVVTTISPETPLQYLGESEPTRHPEEDGLTDNQQWMKVRTRNGDEGWIREVDITKYAPQSDTTPETARRIGSATNDPGQSSAYPAGFDTSHPLVARNIGEYPGSAASGIIVGDILIAENSRLVNEDPATFSGNGIFAQDLATGDILWRSDLLIHQRYTADASGVYVLYPSSTDAQQLVALDLKTGEQHWASEPLSEFSAYPDSTPFLHAGTPIAMSGVVYVPFVDGSVMAFDGGSGDAIWTYMPETIAPIDEVNGNVSIAGTADRIYAANGANIIAVLDRQTGSLIREILLEDVPAKDYSLTLHVQGDHLIVLARSMGSSTPNGRVIAVNPESGQHLWSQNIGFVQSNVLVSPTTVGIVHAEFDNANPIERLFGQDSTSTLTLSLFDLKTGDDIEVPEGVFTPVEDFWSAALASSGNTICLSYVEVTCFDREGNVVKVEGLEAPTVSSIGQELLFWNDQLVILDARHPNQTTGPLT